MVGFTVEFGDEQQGEEAIGLRETGRFTELFSFRALLLQGWQAQSLQTCGVRPHFSLEDAFGFSGAQQTGEQRVLAGLSFSM